MTDNRSPQWRNGVFWEVSRRLLYRRTKVISFTTLSLSVCLPLFLERILDGNLRCMEEKTVYDNQCIWLRPRHILPWCTQNYGLPSLVTPGRNFDRWHDKWVVSLVHFYPLKYSDGLPICWIFFITPKSRFQLCVYVIYSKDREVVKQVVYCSWLTHGLPNPVRCTRYDNIVNVKPPPLSVIRCLINFMIIICSLKFATDLE